jgi:hypothetical protein
MTTTPQVPSRPRAGNNTSTAAATLARLVLLSVFLVLASLPGAAATFRARPVQFECELKGRDL